MAHATGLPASAIFQLPRSTISVATISVLMCFRLFVCFAYHVLFQRLRVELDQARSDIEVAIKRRESSLAAAEEGKHCLVDAGSVLRRDKDGLRVPLEDASVGAGDHEEAKAPSLKGVFATKPQQPLPSSVLRVSAEQEPDVIEEGIATMANEVPHRSIGDTSDTTSHGMVDELMQKLTEETTQRRNARQATREKVRHSQIQILVNLTNSQVYELTSVPCNPVVGRYPYSSWDNRRRYYSRYHGGNRYGL